MFFLHMPSNEEIEKMLATADQQEGMKVIGSHLS